MFQLQPLTWGTITSPWRDFNRVWWNGLLCEAGLGAESEGGEWKRDSIWVWERLRGRWRRKWTLGNNTTQLAEQVSRCGLKSSHFLWLVFNGTCVSDSMRRGLPSYSPCISKAQTWILASDLAATAFCFQHPQSVCPAPLFQSYIQCNSLASIPSLKLQDPGRTGARLQGCTPQALDAEIGASSQSPCRTTVRHLNFSHWHNPHVLFVPL